MLEILAHWFAAVCGQDPGHTWAPGGILLPCCQRCTGLYVGAGVAALLHLWLRPRLTGRFLELHGAFLLLMVPCGFHWVTQGPVLRMLTGVLFGFGVVTFLWLPLSQRFGERAGRSEIRDPKSEGKPKSEGRSPKSEAASRQFWETALLSKEEGGLGLRLSDFARHAFTHCRRRGTYFVILAATLILLPIAVRLGGAVAACALSGLVFWGALALAALVVGDVGLGLLGAFWLLRWLTRPRLQP